MQSLPGGETVEGKSCTKASSMLCSQAFGQIWATFCELQTDFPMTARFLISYAFWESASNAIITLSTTYIRLVLKIDSIVFIGVILLVANVAGALLTGKFGPKLGMRRILMGCLLGDSVVCVLIMIMCRGPDDQMWAYVMMLPLGLVMGALYTAQRAHVAIFIPGGVSQSARSPLRGAHALPHRHPHPHRHRHPHPHPHLRLRLRLRLRRLTSTRTPRPARARTPLQEGGRAVWLLHVRWAGHLVGAAAGLLGDQRGDQRHVAGLPHPRCILRDRRSHFFDG